MSRYLLDTNAISALLRDPAGAIAARLRSVGEETVCTSVIVAAELRYGCAKRPGTRLATRVEAFLDEIPVLAFDRPADRAYGTLRASLEHAGAVIGRNDLLIAAHALALDATVVTANVREFGRVDGLRVENWAEIGAMPSAIT